MTDARKGDWLQTFSGRAFYPLDPRPDEVSLVDIAHSLSMQCRYAGHCRRFYSVAEHSVLMARAMPSQELARIALLHDATEAYMVDLPRPVKNHMPDYRRTEAHLWSVIAERFGLPPHGAPEVDSADNRILRDEMLALMARPPIDWDIPAEPLDVVIECWDPTRAEIEFLQTAMLLNLWDSHVLPESAAQTATNKG